MNNNIYICKICGQEFKLSSSLKLHKDYFHNEKLKKKHIGNEKQS